MKNLIFISTFLLSLTSFAELRILDGGEKGPSMIDPINYGARLGISQTIPGNLSATYACPPLLDANDPSKGRVKNIFKIQRLTADCKIETVKQVGQGLDCAEIKKDPKVIDCTGVTGLEVILAEPTGVAAGAEVKSTKDINLASDELKNAIKNCSADGEFLAIRTPEEPPKGIVASLKDKALCSLENRRISFDALNDQAEFSKLGLYTPSLGGNGFRIGRHTNYYFNYDTNQWCMYHSDEDRRENDCKNNVAQSNAVIVSSCGLNDAQINLDFDIDPSDAKNVVNQGVVKLSVVDGKPIAYVGKGKAMEGQTNAHGNQVYNLNGDLPVMKIELTKESNGTVTTRFQQQSKETDGTNIGGSVMVNPQYSLGDQFASGNCSAGSCFRSYNSLFEQSPELKAKSCNTNTFPVDVKHSQPQCYSCNGVTPGNCAAPAAGPLTPENHRAHLNTMNQCLMRNIQPTITPAAQ